MSTPVIELGPDALLVEGTPVALPIPIGTLVAAWGEPELWVGTAGSVVTWHELGVFAHRLDETHVKTLCVQLRPEADAPAFVPRSVFIGRLVVDGEVVTDELPGAGADARRVAGTATTERHGVRLHASYEGDHLESVEMTVPRSAPPPVPAERYAPRRVADPARFTDLGLKLAVVDELMYQQEVIRPRLDAREFARWYDGRTIDLDAEGHRPVPEILAYLEDLEIDRSEAALVHELVIDAGNDVYREVAPLWDGEDDTFDIGSWADLDLLPHLASLDFVSLTPDDETLDALRARGLDVDA